MKIFIVHQFELETVDAVDVQELMIGGTAVFATLEAAKAAVDDIIEPLDGDETEWDEYQEDDGKRLWETRVADEMFVITESTLR